MHLAPFTATTRAGDRLRRVLRRRDGLERPGLDAVARATKAALGAASVAQSSAEPGHGHRRVAFAVAAVAVTTVAVGAGAYLWWRHRRAEQYAHLPGPRPERPESAPAVPENDEADRSSPPTDATAEAVADERVRDPVVTSALEQPSTATAAPETKGWHGAPARAARREPGRGSRRNVNGLPRVTTFAAPRVYAELPSARPPPQAVAPSLPRTDGATVGRR